MDANVFYRRSNELTTRTSPLAAYDGSAELSAFIKEYSLRPADEFHVLNRPLALVLANSAGTKVRVVTGTLYKQAKGPHWTLTDEDGFILGRSIAPRQIVGWSADPGLEASAVKHLEEMRFDRWDRELEAAMDILNATSTRELVAA